MTVQKYRKKITEVEAVQYDGGNFGELTDWGVEGKFDATDVPGALLIWVVASSVHCRILPGDFVIKEQDGRGFYPCREKDMHGGYDLVNGEHGV